MTMKTAQEAEAMKKAAAASAASQASVITVPASTDSTVPGTDSTAPSATEGSSDVMVLDENGELVELNSLFKAGDKSMRDRTLKQKKASLWPGTRAKGLNRGALRNTVGRVFKNSNSFNTFLNMSWTQGDRSGANKHHHGLYLMKDVNGELRLTCMHCQTAVGTKFGQHLASKKHWAEFEKKKREAEDERRRAELPQLTQVNISPPVANETDEQDYNRFMDEAVRDLQQERIDKGLADSSLSFDQTKYKAQVLEYACRANMLIGELEVFKPALGLKGPAPLVIGSANDLPRLVGKALRSAQCKKLKWIMSQCYPLYGTISDGSPLGANAEALMVRMIRRSDHEIVVLLISLTLFKNSLSGDTIAHHILQTLQNYGLNLEN